MQAHDSIPGIAVRIPCDVDRRNHGMGKESRPCDDVLSDLMAFGYASDASVCPERKLDGLKEGKVIEKCKKSLKTKGCLQTFF